MGKTAEQRQQWQGNDHSRRQSSSCWLWRDGGGKDGPVALWGGACVSEKPLAACCVVPTIACKALSAREDSRVECSPGPWDRCSPLEARAELRKGSGSSTRRTGQSRGGTAMQPTHVNGA